MIIAALVLAATLEGFDARIEQAMRDTGTRSLAVAVVQNDKVLHQRVYNAPAGKPFYLASVPKSMTALAAKILSHEKKLDLDAPLTTTLPQLKLPAPLDPARMSVRDLLTHRLGFENSGVTFRGAYSGDLNDAMLFELMEKHTTVTPRQFSYDNLGYMLATYAAEQAAKEPWMTVLRSRVLDPLSMKQTTNEACVETKTSRTMTRGSGGLCSTIGDMTRWLRVNMSDGMLDGKRIVPLSVMREVHAPQINLERRFGRFDRYAYGLGWYHAAYEGDLVLHHFGSYPDSWAHVSYMPDRGIGVVVLSDEYLPLPDSIALLAYDTLLGRPDAVQKFETDVAGYRKRIADRPARLEEWVRKATAEAADSNRTLQSYAGTYVDEVRGTLVVTLANGELHAAIGDRSSKLTRLRGDAFYARWFRNDGPEKVVFSEDTLTWEGRTFRRQ
jgi:CubicO group peptidase (beta-lactamase class C family)